MVAGRRVREVGRRVMVAGRRVREVGRSVMVAGRRVRRWVGESWWQESQGGG